MVTEYGAEPELGEQAGGRCGLQQVAAAPLDHLGHEDPGRVHVRHHVHVETELPVLIGGFGAAEHDHPGVRAEEVDRPEAGLGRVDE